MRIAMQAPPIEGFRTSPLRRVLCLLLGIFLGFCIAPELGRPTYAQALSHPRLFFSSDEIASLRDKAINQDGYKQIWAPINAYAQSHITNPPVFTMPTSPTLETYRNAGNILITYALAYVINRPQYADPTQNPYFSIVRNYLLTYASWDHWGDENAVGGCDLGFHHMLTGNAIAYDWIYNDLTQADRDIIGQNLGKRAQESYEARNWWHESYIQNHESTNHSALGIAALVLDGEDTRSQSWLDDVIEHMTRDRFVLEGIGDGSWHEGIPYQNYKLTMELPFLINLRRLKGIDLFPHAYMRDYMDWRLYNTLPGTDRQFLSYANFEWSWANGYEAESIIWFEAREYRSGLAQWVAWQIFSNPADGANAHSSTYRTPWLSLGFLYYDSTVPQLAPAAANLPWQITYPDLQSVIWRTGWGDSDLAFGLKGSSYGGQSSRSLWFDRLYPFERSGASFNVGHDHPDVSSFYISRGKTDLTSEYVRYGEDYTELDHNILLVDGRGQYHNSSDGRAYANVDGKLNHVATGRDFAYLEADATKSYWTHANPSDPASAPQDQILANYTRHILFAKPNYFVMVDNVQAATAHQYDWQAYLTTPNPAREGNWIKGVSDNGQIMGIYVLSPSEFAYTTGDEGDADSAKHKYYVRVHPPARTADARFVIVLYPTNTAGWSTKPAIELLGENSDAVGLRVMWNGETQDHLVKYGTQALVSAAGYSFDGNAASVTTNTDSSPRRLFLANGSELTGTNGERLIRNSVATTLEATYMGSGLALVGDNAGGVVIYGPNTDPSQVTLNDVKAYATKSGDYITVYANDGQTFADVPRSHAYYADIEWLYRNGYTAGCAVDPLRYCPEQTMNRAESAVFVERGIHTASYDPPTPPTQVFADLPLDSWAAKWVNGLWVDQYTVGCGSAPLVYCPWQGHTRAEGSVFYLRMLNGPTYEPVQPAQQTFADVPLDTWYAKWVQAAYDEGLLAACETAPQLKFCPQDPLTRALAAHMMVQAKGSAPP